MAFEAFGAFLACVACVAFRVLFGWGVNAHPRGRSSESGPGPIPLRFPILASGVGSVVQGCNHVRGAWV